MSDEKALERELSVVQTLHKRTTEGKVEWEESTQARAFQADFGPFGLIIRETPDPDYPDEPDYSLTIVRKATNTAIETISNRTLRPLMDRTTDDGLNPYNVLRDTYKMARRTALKVDEALENLLQELEEPEG